MCLDSWSIAISRFKHTNFQVGEVLISKFSGKVSNLVRQANQSAVKLVGLVVESFPGFRDQSIYSGKQVFYYKRAQIFVADVYGAFQGHGFGRFHDIDALTMFADYRVPVVLRKLGILQYSDKLQSQVRTAITLFITDCNSQKTKLGHLVTD